jgi:hypothetical protein
MKIQSEFNYLIELFKTKEKDWAAQFYKSWT